MSESLLLQQENFQSSSLGDINVVLPDMDKYTRFSFTLTDTKPLDNEGNKQLSMTISVNSPNNGNKSYILTGTLLGPNISGGGGTGSAAAIALIQASLNAISVREVGADETTLLTFEVRDSLGVPVDQAHQANVSFFIQSGPGGGEYVAPTSALTQGSTGRVQTTLSSGIKAGVVQIVAQTIVGSRTIRSAPVIVNIFGGFPDQAHFSIGSDKLNFPGYNILNLTNRITVIAGDKYSNPVRPGTAVYFRTTGGTINVPLTAYTSNDGVATATLRSGTLAR
ncbi:MAG: Ig-like domain-containing protein [Bacteroidota bacterium]